MASNLQMKGTNYVFGICAVCSNELIEPKLLPCLHRFCQGCLIDLDQTQHNEKIECPTCNYKCRIPKTGIPGLQDDFQMKSLLRLKHLQPQPENEPLNLLCFSCSKRSAYCFKCNEILCDQCHKSRLQNQLLYKVHKKYTLYLTENNLARGKITYRRDIPTCDDHSMQPVQLCCFTCQKMPVCVACTSNEHKDHFAIDVTEIAEVERQKLTVKLTELDQHASKLYDVPKRAEETERRLEDNVAAKTANLMFQYEKQINRIQANIQEQQTQLEQKLSEIENRRKTECSQIRLETERKMQKLLEECEVAIKEKKKKHSDQLQVVMDNHNSEVKKLVTRMESLEERLSHLLVSTNILTMKNKTDLKQILKRVEDKIERYETFKRTTSNMMASKDAWSDALYLSDITLAGRHLLEDVQEEFPQLDILYNFAIDDIIKFDSENSIITEENKSIVVIDGMAAKGCCIDGMARSEDGRIVVTGSVSHEYSHISVINANSGQMIRHDPIRRRQTTSSYPNRFCSFFSQFKIATACIPDEIGLYDVRDGSYEKRTISNEIDSWSIGRCVYCVTTDPINNHIIVGTNCRDVYVFDDQLNYSHTITLPDVICHSRDIAVHRGNLLVCDYGGRNACAVSIGESQHMYTFTKPEDEKGVWEPLSVCKDMNNYIYIIWLHSVAGQLRRVLSQYSEDGLELLATIPLEGDARCLATFEEDGSEKIVVATLKSGKLQTVFREKVKYEINSVPVYSQSLTYIVT
ncbi:uncharacterized protein [Apostichopus japonicus]|uniref:uncharacterized protein isoform X1 n=2 Tax=Stichopus japonicus TaxID=307972 RepID=UPI003AB8A172